MSEKLLFLVTLLVVSAVAAVPGAALACFLGAPFWAAVAACAATMGTLALMQWLFD